MSSSKPKILFQMTGSIAAFKACHVISDLVKLDFDVQTVASSSLFHFVGKSTLEGLSGHSVLTDMYQSGNAMDHIQLARDADLILLCPATANAINRLAAGLADDLIGALFLANNFKTPYWIFPAMNTEMFLHPATQDSIKKLGSWGCRVSETDEGRLACGEVGVGRMLEPAKITAAILEFFQKGQK